MVDEARTRYICGEISKAELLAVNEKWLEMGGARIIEEVNNQYGANKAKAD